MRRTLFARLLAPLSVAALLIATFAMPAAADPRDFNVVNNTSFVITQLWISPSGSDTWSGEMLGSGVIHPGNQVPVTFDGSGPDTCQWDVSIGGQSGQTGVIYKVDLCANNTVTFSDT